MLYIAGHDICDSGAGVEKKITAQIDCFNKSVLDCRFYKLSYLREINLLNKILRRVPLYNVHSHWVLDDLVNEQNIYIRNLGPWDRYAVSFFRKLKELNPKLKIVYELPTYPYDGELKKNIKDFPLLVKDQYNRRNIKKFIDRIATLTDDKEIFGIPTLKISNGIDVTKIRPQKVRECDDIHAIAVANFSFWHGYDRLIEGMHAYYVNNPSRKFFFHLVGNGSEIGRYKKMVSDYRLNDYVIIHGQQTCEALDDIYDQCNLGIASLGGYRKGLNESQELKSREYLAKGLPFIVSVKISDIPDTDKDRIYKQVVNNDSPIDIKEVIKFYDLIYIEGEERVNNRLRQFAKDHFSMEMAMKNVIYFFKYSE